MEEYERDATRLRWEADFRREYRLAAIMVNVVGLGGWGMVRPEVQGYG